MIRWQPGYVYPPVFYPPHLPLDVVSAIVLGLIGIGIFIVAYRRLANGLALVIACTPFAFAHYVDGSSITVMKVGLTGLIAAMVARRTSLAVLRDPRCYRFLIAIGAMVAVMFLSGIGAEHKDAVAREVAKWIEYGLIFLAGVVAFSNDPDDRPIWIAICSVTAVACGLGILQEFVGAPAGVFVHGHAVPRIAGPLEGPNQFSAWIGIAIPILLARALIHRDGVLVGVTAFAIVADALTLSRSGIIAAVVGCAIVVFASSPPRIVRRRFAAGAIVVAVILAVLGASIGLEARFFSLAEIPQPDHLGTRSELWKAAFDLWRTSPIVGIGAGNYELELGRVGLPEIRTHANSLYLQSLAETGIVGFVVMLYFVYCSIQTFALRLVRRPLIIGAMAASIVMALHQIFDYVVFYPKVGAFWFVIVAIGIAEVIATQHESPDVEWAA